MKKKIFITAAAIAMLLCLSGISASAQTYYVCADGNDKNSGTSESEAWASLEKVSTERFMPGDSILFHTGDVWEGQLYPKGNGEEGNPITIASYGTGAKPLIMGDGSKGYKAGGAVSLYNQEYWTIRDIEVTNMGEDAAYRMGISVYCENMIGCGYTIENVTVHDVNGGVKDSSVKQMNDNHWSGGIVLRAEVTAKDKEGYLDDILIENCEAYDLARTAITVVSNWNSPIALADNSYATNVVIRNNLVHNIDGDGIVACGTDGALVEHNVAYDTNMMSLKGNPAANIGIWGLHSKNGVFRYNESYLCHTTHDGYGYDVDGDCNNMTFEYNYSHDNDGGFILLVNYRNQDLTVRYNISQNDHQFGIASAHFPNSPSSYWNLSGKIYNNTIYSKERGKKIMLMFGRPKHLEFYNNLIYAEADEVSEIPCSNPENLFRSNNLYYFGNSASVPKVDEENAIVGKNPKLVAAGTGEIGMDTLDGYKLFEDSPCLGSGMNIENNGGLDYYGNKVGDITNIGAYGGAGISYADEGAGELAKKNEVHFKIGDSYMEAGGGRMPADKRDASAAPYIKNGITMVPVRAAAEALGCKTEWVYESRKTVIDGTAGKLEFFADGGKYVFDDITRSWSCEPEIKNGILYVPLRDICKVMKKELLWLESGDVYITDNPKLYEQ